MRPFRLARISAVDRPCPCRLACPFKRPDTYGGAPSLRFCRTQRSSRTPSQRTSAFQMAWVPRPSRRRAPVKRPSAVRASRSRKVNTPPLNCRWPCNGRTGSSSRVFRSTSLMSIKTFASMARNAARSKGRSGKTLPLALAVLATGFGFGLGPSVDFGFGFGSAPCPADATDAAAAAGNAVAGAAAVAVVVPTTGPRSASSSRLPFRRPESIGTRRPASKLKAPFKRLAPTVASSITTRQMSACLTSRPSLRKAPVVGSVTPTGSPTAASDGPLTLKRPFSPPRFKASVALPLKIRLARPTVAFKVTGTGTLTESSATQGNTPLEASSILSGNSR